MSCPRCTQSTTLSNALNLCSIQMRQDCGRGCIGLLDGYSTVQINADGRLEVCTRTGVDCSCQDIIIPNIGTNSLTLDGGGEFTHVSTDGTVTTVDFCSLLDEVTTDWNDLVLLSGWVAAPGLQPPQYRLVCDTIVQMRGCVYHDDADGDNAVPEVIASLPTVIRPTIRVRLDGNGCGTVEIGNDGNIRTQTSPGDYYRCFEGVQYYLD